MTQNNPRRAQLFDAIFPLALDAITAAHALHTWRQQAGVKSKWSNHEKLQEITTYKELETKFSVLGKVLAAAMPKHWDMADWSFKPMRMGGEVRWAAKGGRSYTSMSIETSQSIFMDRIGFLAALATHKVKMSKPEAKRFKELGLDPLQQHRFALHFPTRGFHEIDARTPLDAYAKLYATGSIPASVMARTIHEDVKIAFKQGVDLADEGLLRLPVWSAARALMNIVLKDPRMRKFGPLPVYSTANNGLCHSSVVESFDKKAAMAVALLGAVKDKPGPMKDFLIRTGDSSQSEIQIRAYCGPSAILQVLLRRLNAPRPRADVENWTVYAVADERGGQARDIAKQFADPPVEAAMPSMQRYS